MSNEVYDDGGEKDSNQTSGGECMGTDPGTRVAFRGGTYQDSQSNDLLSESHKLLRTTESTRSEDFV